MDVFKQKVETMIQQEQLYIKFDVTGLELSECGKICDDAECYMFIVYEGEMVKRCKKCDKYDNAETINEYEETAKILGYNPPTDPMLHYSDTYWYCRFCDEENYFDNDWDCFRDYFDDEKIKWINFKKTNIIHVYNPDAREIQKYEFTLYNEMCMDTPVKHIDLNQKLVEYMCIEFADDPNEPIELCDNLIYEHKSIYHKINKN
jgi:hypothetical protein